MKYLFSLLSFLFLSSGMAFSQTNEGDWSAHYSYSSDITNIAKGVNLVYAVSDGKLFAYDKQSNETLKIYPTGGVNSDVLHISYNEASNSLLIIRKNLFINILSESGDMHDLSFLQNTTIPVDKVVNDVFMDGETAYICGNFGLLIVNMAQKKVDNICFFGTPVYSITLLSNKFIMVTKDGTFSIAKRGNYQDINEWASFSLSEKDPNSDNYKFNDPDVRYLTVFQNRLHFVVPNKALFYLDIDNKVYRTLLGQAPISLIKKSETNLIVLNTNSIFNFSEKNTYTTSKRSETIYAADFDNANNELWIGIKGKNLSKIKCTSPEYEYILTGIKPNGPTSNIHYFLNYSSGKLFSVSGGYRDNNFGRQGSINEFENKTWYNYPVMEKSKDFVNVITDPSDPTRVFVASWGKGIYEYKDRAFVRVYNEYNSTLTNIDNTPATEYTRINGLTFDKNNRLWTAASHVKNHLNAFDPTSNGELRQSYGIETEAANTNALDLHTDKYNNKWFTGFDGGSNILIFNENGTMTNTSDDKSKFLKGIPLEDGTKNSVGYIYRICSDLNNNIWIASEKGLFYAEIQEDPIETDFVFQQIPITDINNGYGMHMFDGTIIRSVRIDKANQKWVATRNHGAFLVSENRQQIIHHFTAENSKLPSNFVYDIAIDDINNLVYFGTDRGLVSLKYTPTVSDKSTAIIYPQQVTDYGTITIAGLRNKSRIIITDNEGNTIIQGFANEQKYLWDLIDQSGKKVNPGNYSVFGTDSNNRTGYIGMISISNK